MNTIHVDLKRAGESLPDRYASTAGAAIKIVFHHFASPDILEDYIDAVEANAALSDPGNQQLVSWEAIKARLGL
jgi:hypothetical protein